jgi:hypothetical protein
MRLQGCIVHIGFHKTGTTSIQHFLRSKREKLSDLGIHFFSGSHIDGNHVELHAATMRPDRTSTFKAKSGLVFDDAYYRQTTDKVADFLRKTRGEIALFSAEGLSLLCHSDETERLAKMLPADVSIVAYLRNPEDYLRSHARQIAKSGQAEVQDKTSHAYFGPDSWLADYEYRLSAYRATFGPRNVHVVDYDEAVARDGNVIPSFLRLLGVGDAFTAEEWQGIRLNRT